MNLNQLRYFATIAQLNNLSKASEILGVNQPALSKSINSLEEELGFQLFERNGKKISLNPQGERFLECVDQIYDDLFLASEDISKMLGEQKSLIKIGAVGCSSQVVKCASEFKKGHPECEFSFNFGIESLDKIDIKNYDIVIYPDESKYENWGGYEIATEKYMLAVSTENPLSDSPVINPKTLENQDIIYVKKNNRPEFAYHICKALEIGFNSINYTDSRQAQLQAIASNLAIGIVPEGITDTINKEKIALIPFLNKNFSRKLMMCFRKDKHLTPIAQEFKEFITEYFAEKK